MNEEWKDIKGYEGLYQISSLGRVYSFYKKDYLKPGKDKSSYLFVNLCKNNKSKPFLIHRLVALHFIENLEGLPQVNHKDENKQNNKVSNLEWCTQSYNMNYGTRVQRISEANKGINHPMYGKHHTLESKNKISNTQKMNGKNKGSKHPKARKVQCVTTGKKFNCIQEAGEYYLLNKSVTKNISKCCKGKIKYCGKHPVTGEKLVWKYID